MLLKIIVFFYVYFRWQYIYESWFFVFPNFIADYLGVKPVVPAYLRPGLTQEDLLTGVSFASGGSGYDPLTPIVVVITSILWFSKLSPSFFNISV